MWLTRITRNRPIIMMSLDFHDENGSPDLILSTNAPPTAGITITPNGKVSIVSAYPAVMAGWFLK